jgi:hypothetical protein
LAGTPPAAYSMPTFTSASPIIVTTSPVTSGGNAKRIRPMTSPSDGVKQPADQITPPKARPAHRHPCPPPADHDRNEGEGGALHDRQRAPTGPTPTVCNSVAMPANSIDIWIM